MSGLHQACARAIADRVAYLLDDGWPADDIAAEVVDTAVGVCLAEAQCAVEALPASSPLGEPGWWVERGAALAVLAALAEEQA